MNYVMLCLLFTSCLANAQRDWSPPKGNEALPEKLQSLRKAIDVIHFPRENDPIKIKDTYYWKHMTSILCKESEIKITEYGAYLFYDGAWNLRKIYPLKELDQNFGTKKRKMLQAQPYTWNQNWRVDKGLYGGWALWYFIGTTTGNETVYGYEMIHTTSNLLNH
jgi:hypothetical protein